MTLPRKKSRTLSVDDAQYRWLVSSHNGVIHLTVESDQVSGQILQAYLEPHDRFKQEADGIWHRCSQGRAVTPDVVKRLIRHGLTNGWQPLTTGKKPLHIHSWETDCIAPDHTPTAVGEVLLKDIAIEQVSELRYDLSLDPHWRKILFDAPPFKRYPLADDYVALSLEVREYGLKFAAFNDGWTENGFVVFGIESVDFPNVVMYTVNNPAVV
jgi:hypothetical protein